SLEYTIHEPGASPSGRKSGWRQPCGRRRFFAAFLGRSPDQARIVGPRFEHNLNGTRSETEQAKLLLADPVGRVDRLRLAEIRDRLRTAAQRFIGEGAVVVGLDIGRTELDRLREISNRAVAVT